MINCRECKKAEPEIRFATTPSGGKRSLCESCRAKQKKKANPERFRREWVARRLRNPVAYILKDCKRIDRVKGLGENDLDRLFLIPTISNGCSYCGETQGRISLDRIDNEQPHNKSNVVPCCFRCNMIRGSMPYEAWLVVAPAVRVAKELGLFGNWRARPSYKAGNRVASEPASH
jgi:hypothetical protein